jgi:Icc-related predicted phosphoesterase
MKMVAVSDTHGSHDYLGVPDGDVLIHCGDAELSDWGRYNSFLRWFDSQPHDHKLFVPGNHDFLMQTNTFNCVLDFEKHGIYTLIDKEHVIDDVKFYGSPWTPMFNNWAFMKSEKYLKSHWDSIPEDTNVLITHGPAYGLGDAITRTTKHLGSKSLEKRLRKLPNLDYHFFGHIHSSSGILNDEETGFVSCNCSVLNEQYKLEYPAIVQEYVHSA